MHRTISGDAQGYRQGDIDEMYYLISNNGMIELQQGVTRIGRLPDNDIVLDESNISRHHAELALNDERLEIKDLGSTNGTIVNGRKITKSVLNPEDVIDVGGQKFVVTLVSNVDHAMIQDVEAEREIALEVDVTNIRSGLEEIDQKVGDEVSTSKQSREKRTIQILKQDLAKAPDEKNERKLAILLEVSRALNAVQDVNELLESVMDLLFTIFEPDGAVLALMSESTQRLEPVVTRWRMGQDLGGNKVHFSRSIAKKVYESGKAVIAADAASDQFLSSDSIITQNIRSVVCVPLNTHDRKIGVIYIDHRLATGIFDEEDLKFIAAFASNAAIAIERSQLQQNLHKEQKIRSNLERYLSPSIVDSIVTDMRAVELGTTRRMVTAVFVDIRNFTKISSRMHPDHVVEKLNNCFNKLVQIIFQYEGTLDKYLGDGLLAIWGAPLSGEDDALRAVQASIDMLESMEKLNQVWSAENRNQEPLYIGIGISSGPVLAGNIGTEKRMEYTIIGDDVNLAARLCEKADPQQILLSEKTWELVKSKIKTRQLPPITVKGKSSAVQIYSVER